MFISNAYAQAAQTTSESPSLLSFWPFIVMFIVMYFVMIRPQMKRQKEQQSMLAALSKGDEVITTAGILGKVVKIGEAFIVLEVSNGYEITVQKSSVTTLLPKGTIKSV